MAKVSIVVPVYNVESYLPRCLNSLTTQTLHDIEIICVNDGSADGSLCILQDYAKRDARIMVISQPNGGVSAARNTGLGKVSADYVMFCDPDDAFAVDMCEKMYDAMISSKADLAICGVDVRNLDLGIVSTAIFDLKGMSGLKTIDDGLRSWVNEVAWNKIYRAHIIKDNRILFPEGMVHEDVAFYWQYIMMANSIFFVNLPLYHYYLRANSIMGMEKASVHSVIDALKAFRFAVEFMIKNGVFNKHIKFMMIEYIERFNYVYNRVNGQGLDEIYDEAAVFAKTVNYHSLKLSRSMRRICDFMLNRDWHTLGTRRKKFLGITIIKESFKPQGYCLRFCNIPVFREKYL